jgi:hypothetical protein
MRFVILAPEGSLAHTATSGSNVRGYEPQGRGNYIAYWLDGSISAAWHPLQASPQIVAGAIERARHEPWDAPPPGLPLMQEVRIEGGTALLYAWALPSVGVTMLDLQVGHPSIRVVPGPITDLPREPATMVIEEDDLDVEASLEPEPPTS